MLGAQLFAGAVVAWIDWRLLRRLGIALRRFHVDIARPLAREGASFLVLGAVMALQWNINAVMLSKLAEAPDVGWYAASQRLVGFLIFPCSAVIASLYPTLCRLLKESPQEALETTRSALSIVSWIALPVATCCALFPDIGIQIFSRESFGPAEDNLRISAMTVFCLYLAMVLATYLNALGLQRAWTKLQLASVVISSALNWLLIPVFQRTHGNGGLGVVCATLAAEAFLVTGGLWVAPARIVNRSLLRSFGWALLSAVVMGVVGSLLRPLTSSWMAAPICVVVYVGCLRVTGVLNPGTLQILQSMLRRQQPAT